MSHKDPNAVLITSLAEEAECDRRTARKALEHGYMTIRRTELRDRIESALKRRPELASQYSKEHYP